MMRFRIVALSAVAAVSLASAVRAETCSLGLIASLDMTILRDGRFTVPASVNGTTVNLLVDTAGVFSNLSNARADALGLDKKPTGHEMYGAGGKITLFSVQVASFKLGVNEAKNFHFGVEPQAPSREGIDGELAPDVLSRFDVEIDVAHKKLNLFSQDHCPGKVVYWTKDGYADLPFILSGSATDIVRNNHIDFTMQLDGHDLQSVLDTGTTNSWLRMKSAIQVFGLDEDSPSMKRVSPDGAAEPVYQTTFKSLSAGGVSDTNPSVYVVADNEEKAFRMAHSEKSRDDPIYGARFELEPLIVGMNVISKLHLFIAYKEHKIYVTSADAH
jgi:predicted aspartyl protease